MAIKLIFLVVFFADMLLVGIRCRKHSMDVNGFVLGGRAVGPYAEQEGLTEQMKAENPTEWVQKMNNIRNRVAETVCADLIFA